MEWFFNNVTGILVRFTLIDTRLETATGDLGGKTAAVMVATMLVLREGS
ncbi:MAG: hypothetical protein MK165_11965 [Pirellulaceae bacterium]|nr:hypothetical protein [Pirellulaceae bacterium]